ncbi:MAG: hypothetical protein KY467_02580 [Gemmatimonadetes bacterium]|nr:hypothetical protein [Gemmatimonadota bacterium]
MTDGLDRMVTGRVRDIFLEAGITGWEAELVGARYTGARAASLGEPPSLWRLVTTGWGGIAPARSGLRRVEGPCPGCGKQVYRGALDPSRLFDCERWDGSDIFMIWPFPAYVWVTPRVADVVRANNLKGARLLSLADPEARVFAAAAELGVGTWRLSNYMPRDRARELGTPLGIA